MLKSLFRWFSRRPSTPSITLPTVNASPPDKFDEFTRREIREWLNSPTTKLVLSLVEAKHPGRNVPSMLPRTEADKDAAVCFLQRIRGWEMHRNAILGILYVPNHDTDVEETYTPAE